MVRLVVALVCRIAAVLQLQQRDLHAGDTALCGFILNTVRTVIQPGQALQGAVHRGILRADGGIAAGEDVDIVVILDAVSLGGAVRLQPDLHIHVDALVGVQTAQDRPGNRLCAVHVRHGAVSADGSLRPVPDHVLCLCVAAQGGGGRVFVLRIHSVVERQLADITLGHIQLPAVHHIGPIKMAAIHTVIGHGIQHNHICACDRVVVKVGHIVDHAVRLHQLLPGILAKGACGASRHGHTGLGVVAVR